LWGDQVISTALTEEQKGLAHFRTHGVGATVLPAGMAEAIPEKTSQWLGAAFPQWGSQYIFHERKLMMNGGLSGHEPYNARGPGIPTKK
jgi:hypothetical protein